MLTHVNYDRNRAVEYAKQWAFRRNPRYYDFSNIGGDCTNFVSQCVYAGCGVMNYTPLYGWFYKSVNDRTPSWTGVEYIYQFLIGNTGMGPYAEESSAEFLEIGDLVQFANATGDFYHTPIVTGFRNGVPLLAAHTYDAYDKPMTDYHFDHARYLHILGARR